VGVGVGVRELRVPHIACIDLYMRVAYTVCCCGSYLYPHPWALVSYQGPRVR
jgi:hypothetical protein